ncbi:polysaccharide synthesis [Enterovibrio norvegicus FF-33]|uniref:capsule biosynthesis GfcC family protein n=1 Tax=Enterovibrio norvegicus TaxID=188144 RepID=UPI00030DE155|nr:capsule biosynthesis GfcC family protein [Enterovibrio norvegicus]OEE68095.1 polysaccharide synthesis [Enterovibrio norvegicus FF-33]
MTISSFINRAAKQSHAVIATIILVVFSQSAFAEQTVLTVTTGDSAKKTYSVTFNGSPRVSQVVEQGRSLVTKNGQNMLAHSTDVIYWQGAGLFNNSLSDGTSALYDGVTRQLSALTEHWQGDDEKRAAVQSLSEFLAASTFKNRIDVELDHDFYLAGSKVNPLVQGGLTLLLPPRQNHVWVIGAVAQSTDTDFSPSRATDDYLTPLDTLNLFGINNVSVVQPDGVLETHKVAYWNEVPKNVAPGAIIFVPYQGLPSALKSLNGDIPRLLQHRVM